MFVISEGNVYVNFYIDFNEKIYREIIQSEHFHSMYENKKQK